MSTDRGSAQTAYQIKVQGSIGQNWSDWFQGLAIAYEQAGDGSRITTLTGPVADQAALRGVLSKIWDLNLTLISVTRVQMNPDNVRRAQGG